MNESQNNGKTVREAHRGDLPPAWDIFHYFAGCVRNITGDERTEEVARMLSGAKVTESSLKHAEQMIKANA